MKLTGNQYQITHAGESSPQLMIGRAILAALEDLGAKVSPS